MSKLMLFLPVLLLFLVSCQSHQSSRRPASSKELTGLTEYYETKVALDQLSDQIESFKNNNNSKQNAENQNPSPLNLNLQMAQSKKMELIQSAKIRQENLGSEIKTRTPVAVKIPFTIRWRRHHDEFILHNLKAYSLDQGQPMKKMYLSTDTTSSFYLQLTNFVFSWNKSGTKVADHHEEQPFLNAELSCNKEAIVHAWPQTVKATPTKSAQFKWYDKKFNGQRAYIEINDPLTTCELKFSHPEQRGVSGLQLIPEIEQLSRIGNPHLEGEVCFLPDSSQQVSPTDRFFLSQQIPYTTCPLKVGQYETLEDPLEGINAKIRVLTGQNLSDDFIKRANPFAPLDFSKAPKLDAILISYLVFRADFGGSVIMQALKHHARQGTLIRIALSDVITLGKDRQMLLDLQDEFPNVKLLFYSYKPQEKSLKEWIASLHRTNHIKLFLTYSKSQENANKVILGGRNIHDGFIFDQPSANYVYPTLVDYSVDGDESWARWEDFETLFTSKDLTQQMMGQFFSVLHADYQTVHFRSYTESVASKTPVDPQYFNLNDNEVYIRSLVSIPFKDDHLLEKTYIQMIDSAEKTLKVSTPYFNLTQGILKAFERAADRGVDIQLITRLDLKGDTADLVLSDVNKRSVNKLFDKIKIYEYTTKGKILHSKLFLVDNRFIMMGSVNLNLRSFHHDIENATFVYGPGFYDRIEKIYEGYKSESRLLTEKQKTTFWKTIIIKIIGTAL